MGGRLMKYIAIVAVAVISILTAIPLSHQTVQQQHSISSATLSAKKVVLNKPTIVNTSVANIKPVNTTPAPTVVVPVSYAAGCQTYDSTFRQYNWNVATAEAICQAESSGNPYAVSSTNDYGLMQLHDEEIFNPYDNIAAAYRKYEVQGWEAWTTYNTGAYAQYL